MRTSQFSPAPLAAAVSLALSTVLPLAQADTIIDHANGYTLNAAGTLQRFSSLAFDDLGRIVAVGSERETAIRLPKAEHIDAQGKTLLPGLIDAHGHVFELGEIASGVELFSATTLGGAVRAVAEFGRSHPKHAWVVGFGWNQEVWKLGRFPTAAELDAVVGDRPVLLHRVDGHAIWVNTKALEMAGITRDTPDPNGGKIERDAAGKPSGVLVDAAMELVAKVVPLPTPNEARGMLDNALSALAKAGLTSVHDAGIKVVQDDLYRDYADHGRLTTRVYAMIGDTTADFDELSKEGPLKSYGNDVYALAAVKLYSDGALGSRGAALLAPYSDMPSTRGLLFYPNAEMLAKMNKAMKAGYQVNVHAIGDAGNRQILDAYAQLIPKYNNVELRHRIEHAQVVALEDIPRFKALGIIPSMQPTHATSDQNMAEQRVGHERIKGAYAWRTFLEQGSRIACGSDFPVESPNPFEGLHAAVTRQNNAGVPAGGWYKNQAMTLTEAFRCFTLDAAYAAHQENVIGTLEPGKWADFILIDRDLFKVPAEQIGKTQVLQTWMGGKRVYKKDKRPD
ncbi:amidohydrolase [Duganella violaceipulchra]|uniref:Amidohydrolase n=1 Tax=Duganella violaceipulchra TaxID=2849652 RepID=A0AA41HIG8_9BURK|nr:amidohydrolase [Duganella violaceicalia]MBV6325159.1 amidohydrolase [Duganella violaceicalia]MCP2011585.1 putative amidohydrolase YtcJ [Duganella violaceicalia]